MALIECPDCKTQISDIAPSCPRCGRPMPMPDAKQTVLIELTAKRYKAQKVLGGILTFAGFALGATAGNIGWVGLIMVPIGLYFLMSARIGAWWHHG